MKKTSEYTWDHRGWDIEYKGNGYKIRRRTPFDGCHNKEMYVKTLKQAKVIIENTELNYLLLGLEGISRG